MKVVIAPDSFKESLTAQQVCDAIQSGFQRVLPQAEYTLIPVADGGEGTVQSLVDATHGSVTHVTVEGPLGADVDAFYGLLGDSHFESDGVESLDKVTKTAVIEMAAASGLHHVPTALRDPKCTSTIGTGQLITSALNSGIQKLIIGLGGSATNDGGIGMMAELGVKFLDVHGQMVPLTGAGLSDIDSIDTSNLHPGLEHCEILIACDVDNPLCGEKGASAVFGPQKGATESDVQLLDDGLKHYSQKLCEATGKKVADQAGAGAAGGMGAALLAFTNATMKPGIEIVLDTVQLSERVKGADLVITGEGRIDGQTVHGKTPMGVAKAAKAYDIPVIGIAGCLGAEHQAVYQCGIDSVFAATPKAMSLEEAFEKAGENVTNLAENVARIWQIKAQ